MTKHKREVMLCEAMEAVRLATRRLSTGKLVKRADALSAAVERRPSTAWDRAIAFAWTAEAEARLAEAFAAAHARSS
jgi:hypothetical protein